ncbi:MAG: hypothetical protein H6565_01570 [Lewinellaceae bacterium]|nr:hypothetical protein [Lewinellaceae bacterium]
MKKAEKYRTVYKDGHGIVETYIVNNFQNFFINIEGVEFIGGGGMIESFRLIDKEKYSESDIKRFSLFEGRWESSKTGELYYELYNYSLKIFIPILILEVETGRLLEPDLEITTKVGNRAGEPEMDFQLELFLKTGDETFSGKDETFELAANKILDQFSGRYKFRNCFGCNFSDYSVYGNNALGNLLCLVGKRKEYMKVKTLEQYHDLSYDAPMVQEIDICSKFEYRQKINGLYRR